MGCSGEIVQPYWRQLRHVTQYGNSNKNKTRISWIDCYAYIQDWLLCLLRQSLVCIQGWPQTHVNLPAPLSNAPSRFWLWRNLVPFHLASHRNQAPGQMSVFRKYLLKVLWSIFTGAWGLWAGESGKWNHDSCNKGQAAPQGAPEMGGSNRLSLLQVGNFRLQLPCSL